MVVSNPASDEEIESIKEALRQLLETETLSIKNVTTHDGEYDYKIKFREQRLKPKFRKITALVLLHNDASDWEINITSAGPWQS